MKSSMSKGEYTNGAICSAFWKLHTSCLLCLLESCFGLFFLLLFSLPVPLPVTFPELPAAASELCSPNGFRHIWLIPEGRKTSSGSAYQGVQGNCLRRDSSQGEGTEIYRFSQWQQTREKRWWNLGTRQEIIKSLRRLKGANPLRAAAVAPLGRHQRQLHQLQQTKNFIP